MEAKKYPFFGGQPHPEKAPFEWSPDLAVSHTTQQILLSQYVGNFVVNQARMNYHQFPSPFEEQ
jgi:hypothetical protein